MPRTQEGFNDYVAAELRVADKRMDELVGKVNAIEQDQAAANALLKENTEAINAIKSDTADMLATFESWRGAMRVLIALAGLPMNWHYKRKAERLIIREAEQRYQELQMRMVLI